MTYPSNLVRRYESLLVHNLGAVRTIESTLRNVTWLLPGRFEDAEVASEGLCALLNLVSSYHDILLDKRIDQTLSLPPHPFASSSSGSSSSTASSSAHIFSPSLPVPSDHSRYTRYWTHTSPLYKRASRLLVTLSYVELLVEMVARRRAGHSARWRVIFGIESLKTLLRLVLLGITKRPVLNPPVPQREYDLSSLPESAMSGSTSRTTSGSKPIVTSVPPNASLRSHLYPMSGALPDSHLPPALSLLPEISSRSAYGSELLSSIATLLHIILLIRASMSLVSPLELSNRNSFTAQRNPTSRPYRPASLPTLSRSLPPFLVPLTMHLLARQLRPSPGDSILLAQHYAQLDRKLASTFFLTGPMWVGWTRPRIMGVIKVLQRIPLGGLVGEFVQGYVPLVDDYFYCLWIFGTLTGEELIRA